MGIFTGKKVKNTYKDALKIDSSSDNAGIDSTLRVVEGGGGATSALKLSSGAAQVDNLKFDGNTISSEDTNGNITLSPNGSGEVVVSNLNVNNAFTLPTSDGTVEQVLQTDGNGAISWATIGTSLSGLSDTTITSVDDNDIIAYDSTSSKYINQSASEAGLAAASHTHSESDITDLSHYTHPTTAGNKHIPTGGSAGKFLKYSASGTAVWATPSYTTNTDTTYDLLVPASTTAIRLDPSSGSNDDITITGGTNVTVTRTSGTELSIASTDTTYTSSDFSHDSLSGVTANEHIDWTTDQGATNLHSGNYTNTGYRPLGVGATDACAGDDSRLSDARTPTAHDHDTEYRQKINTYFGASNSGSARWAKLCRIEVPTAYDHAHFEWHLQNRYYQSKLVFEAWSSNPYSSGIGHKLHVFNHWGNGFASSNIKWGRLDTGSTMYYDIWVNTNTWNSVYYSEVNRYYEGSSSITYYSSTYSGNNGADNPVTSGYTAYGDSSDDFDVKGDISVSGTVDGRDVASDGTKLDNIDLGASADTANELLDLIKTVDGSGSGLDADLLDGISSASFLRSDATDTASGNLTFTGTNSYGSTSSYKSFIYGGLAFTDYANSALTNGRIYFQNDNFYLRGGGEGTADATTNTALYVRHSSNFGEVWHSRNDGTGSGLDADLLDGQHGSYYATADHGHTGLDRSSWDGIKSSTSSGYIEFGPANTSHAHIYTDRPNFYFNKELLVNNNTVWNEGNDGAGSGLDADTLDGIQAASFLRSDANDTSSGVLTLSRASSDGINLKIYNTTNASSATIEFSDNNGQAQKGRLEYHHADGSSNSAGNSFHFDSTESSTAVIIDQTSGNSGFYVGTNEVWHTGNDGSGSGLDADKLDGIQASSFLRSDANDTTTGRITQPNLISFKAKGQSHTAGTSWTIARFNDVSSGNHCHNNGNHFSTSTYKFTAPVSGYYFFSANQRIDSFSGTYVRLAIIKNTTSADPHKKGLHAIVGNGMSTNYQTLSVSGTYYLAQNDYVCVTTYSQNDSSYTRHNESMFTGHFLG